MGVEQYGSDKGYVHYISRIEEDTVTENVFYVGVARPRTASSAAAWAIKKITVTETGSPLKTSVSVLWAGGDDRFAHIFDNRQSLSYS